MLPPIRGLFTMRYIIQSPHCTFHVLLRTALKPNPGNAPPIYTSSLDNLTPTTLRLNIPLCLDMSLFQIPKHLLPYRSRNLSIHLLNPLTSPSIRPQRTRETNQPPESAPLAARTPSPARATPNREMIHVKPDISEENPDCRTEENIKAMVSVVEPARRRNKERRGSRHERDEHQVHRGRGTAFPHRGIVIGVTLVFNRVAREIGECDGEFGAEPEG